MEPPATCARCACDTDKPSDRCKVLRSADERRQAWRASPRGTECLLFQEWTAPWPRQTAADPYAGQLQNARYRELKRDPVTGRPVIE